MNKKGFTLIEVMIAISILLLIAVMIARIKDNAYRGTEKAAKYDTIYQYGRIALKKITDDLSMAFLVGPSLTGKASDGTAAMQVHFYGKDESDGHKLDFATFSNIRLVKNEKKSDQVEVGYSVADCPDTEERMKCLMRRESAVIDKDVAEGGVSTPIARNVKKFKVEYYDPTKQEWRDGWSTEDPVFQNRLPRAARITLVFPDPQKEDEEIEFTTETVMPLFSGPIEF